MIMKKISVITLLLFFLLSTALYGIDFSYDFGLISSVAENDDYDWDFNSELRWKYFSASILYQKKESRKILNYETEIVKNWKYFGLSNKRTYIENRINDISLEGILRYPIENKEFKYLIIKYIAVGSWEAGFRQTWSGENMRPHSNVVFGKTLKREVDIFFCPATLEYSFYYISENFENWKKENEVRFDLWLLSYISIYFKYQLNENWLRISNGMKIRL